MFTGARCSFVMDDGGTIEDGARNMVNDPTEAKLTDLCKHLYKATAWTLFFIRSCGTFPSV